MLKTTHADLTGALRIIEAIERMEMIRKHYAANDTGSGPAYLTARFTPGNDHVIQLSREIMVGALDVQIKSYKQTLADDYGIELSE